MRKENFFGIVLLLLLSALGAEAFKFAAEEAGEPDAAEAAAADAPVAFGEKKKGTEEGADVGLHPTTYDKDGSSSREDRQLGKNKNVEFLHISQSKHRFSLERRGLS